MEIEKYRAIADKYNIIDIKLISSEAIVFDIRSILKCRWGCDYSKRKTARCDDHGLSIDERKQMVNSYDKIFLLHGHNGHEMSRACLEIERELFLDGNYYAFTLRTCNYCKDCVVKKGSDCVNPEMIRPCEELFGINVFQTVRNLGLPINVLKSKDEVQNRYGFVLIE